MAKAGTEAGQGAVACACTALPAQWPPLSLDEAPPVSVEALATHSPLLAESGLTTAVTAGLATSFSPMLRAVR